MWVLKKKISIHPPPPIFYSAIRASLKHFDATNKFIFVNLPYHWHFLCLLIKCWEFIHITRKLFIKKPIKLGLQIFLSMHMCCETGIWIKLLILTALLAGFKSALHIKLLQLLNSYYSHLYLWLPCPASKEWPQVYPGA